RRHTRSKRDWSSDVCSSDLVGAQYTIDFASHNGACKVFDIDLVDDTHARRDHFEVVKGGLSPPQELVALTVTLIFNFNVSLNGIWGTKVVDLNRVVDHQFGRDRKSTRLNSSHVSISYAVFCLKRNT